MNNFLLAMAVGFVAVAAQAQAPAGQVLLLTNQRILEGEVSRDGDLYRVARAGGETLVPARQALAVCADLDAAYRVLLARGDANDGAHRLTLAKWCYANGLRTLAAAEAQSAAKLRPNHRESQALAKSYAQLAKSPVVSAPRPTPDAVAETSADCSPEALERFTLRVQPVLMNACASCHAGAKAAKFRLERTYADSRDKRRQTLTNLAASLAAIDRVKPAASPLLAKALAAHGGATVPPLRDRGVPAFQVLDEWVALAAGAASPVVVPVAATVPAGTSAFGRDAPKPAETKEPIDPFDPAEFNRRGKRES